MQNPIYIRIQQNIGFSDGKRSMEAFLCEVFHRYYEQNVVPYMSKQRKCPTCEKSHCGAIFVYKQNYEL